MHLPRQSTMTEYIDISILVTSDMLVYPGDPSPALPVTKTGSSDDQWNTGRYEGGLHVGTHIDAPCHRVQGGKKMHEIDLSSFVGLCLVVDCTSLSDSVNEIGRAHV